MQIQVKEKTRKVIKKDYPNFPVGSIKWKDITKDSDSTFTHMELGSNGLYYSAEMLLSKDDTLRLWVGIKAPGDEQKWIRNK